MDRRCKFSKRCHDPWVERVDLNALSRFDKLKAPSRLRGVLGLPAVAGSSRSTSENPPILRGNVT